MAQVYDWYKIFNLPDFVATGLVQRSFVMNLEGRGIQTFVVSQGNEVSIYYDDAFLPVNFLGRNLFVQGLYAVYKDPDTNNVWFGFQNDES
jgi:hypothetical protein